MKKLILILCSFILLSCSREELPDGIQSITKGTLPLKITSSANETILYKYDGNKIIEATGTTFKNTYYYNANLISKITTSDGGQNDYFYNGDRLIKDILTDVETPSIKNIYVSEYNWINSSKAIKTETKMIGNSAPIISTTELYFDANGNIKKEVSTNFTIDYTYDDNTNPFYYVEGYNKISFAVNNPTEIKKSSGRNNSFSYVYNNKGLPTSIVEKEFFDNNTFIFNTNIQY